MMDRKQWNVIFLSVYLMILFSAEFAVLNMQRMDINTITGLQSLSNRCTIADLQFLHGVLHVLNGLLPDVGLSVPNYGLRAGSHFVGKYFGVCDPVARCKTIISSIHDEKPEFTVEGYFVTGIAYTVFAISVWLAPSVISVLGSRLSMAIATLGYIVYLVAFSVEEAWTMYTGAVVVGICEALLWTSQGNYLVLNSEPHTVNRNLGIFWVIFSSAELYGNIFVYYKLEGKKYIDAETRKTVIYVMSSVAGASLLMFIVLGKTEDSFSFDSKHKKEGPMQALKKTWEIFNSPDMRTLCITFVFIGMQQAFRCGIYSACVGFTLKFGDCAKQLVVLSGVFLGLGELVGGLYQIALSGFTKRHMFGQCFVLGTGLVCQLISYATTCLNMPAEAVFGNTLDESYIQPSVYLAMMCSFLLGLADCCCHTQAYSIMTVMFPENSSQTCAIYKFIKGIMVAISFYCSNHLNLHQQLAVLVPMSVIANIAFYKVNKSVVSKIQQSSNDHMLETINSRTMDTIS